jgi:hypothetical protein
MKVLFLDESGDHNLSVIDPLYPLFVLGGVIVEKDYAEGTLKREFDAFKQAMFGRTDIVLHTADITRNRRGFERMIDTGFRERFYKDLNNLMRRLEYKVVACVIRKDAHLARYGVAALDPYLLSLDVLVERFIFEVGKRKSAGVIVAEKRDPTLDHELELAWLNLKVQGTGHVSPKSVELCITGLNLRAKTEDIAGLQLADLVVTPIGRHVLGKPDKDDYRIISQKYRRSRKGDHLGYGLVILPKETGPAPATQSPAHD